ncbi:hypothetical protein PROFUN_16935, partial [Planoprotostelium fungivorum]
MEEAPCTPNRKEEEVSMSSPMQIDFRTPVKSLVLTEMGTPASPIQRTILKAQSLVKAWDQKSKSNNDNMDISPARPIARVLDTETTPRGVRTPKTPSVDVNTSQAQTPRSFQIFQVQQEFLDKVSSQLERLLGQHMQEESEKVVIENRLKELQQNELKRQAKIEHYKVEFKKADELAQKVPVVAADASLKRRRTSTLFDLNQTQNEMERNSRSLLKTLEVERVSDADTKRRSLTNELRVQLDAKENSLTESLQKIQKLEEEVAAARAELEIAQTRQEEM